MVNAIKKRSGINEFFGKFKKGKTANKSPSTKTGGGARAFLSKLSGGFLLPISVLSIAGLFLGVGATIVNGAKEGDVVVNQALNDFGLFIQLLGNPVFDVLPLLFAIAIVISFTEEAGVAVFNAVLGYVIFTGLQTVFIHPITSTVIDPTDNTKKEIITGYNVLFGGGARSPAELLNLVGTPLGFRALQTSVFGGIIIGFVVQWAYRKFHTIRLPQWLAFYGGKRFVAFPVIGLMIPVVFLFLLLWPYIGYAFNWIGQNSGKLPIGLDSFIFGFIERILVPFGLHHAFYSPLWYTAAGADVAAQINTFIDQGGKVDSGQLEMLAKLLGNNSTLAGVVNGKIVGQAVFGDSTTSLKLLGWTGGDIRYTLPNTNTEISKPIFLFIQDIGLRVGRFLQGKFSFMQWGLPAAGAAMVMAAPKENRQVAIAVVFPAAVTSFVTGVTEPIEFTFLFLAPWLFFGFHAFFCALSFMLMNVLSVHVPQSFSGGFLDLVIYGMIPVTKGTNFWWTIVVGLAYAPIYYFVFYFSITKLNIDTPGRGGNIQLFTKKDYQAKKDAAKLAAAGPGGQQVPVGSESAFSDEVDPQTQGIIEAYGGRENIVRTSCCASRLRIDVKDANLVDVNRLKALGAFGVQKVSPTHVQAIFGPISELLLTKIDKALKKE